VLWSITCMDPHPIRGTWFDCQELTAKSTCHSGVPAREAACGTEGSRMADSLDGSVASAFEMVTRSHEFTKTFQSRKMKVADDVYL
jgi:hypothetical protein